MNDSNQQANQFFGRDHLQNDPNTLGVAETLVNIAKIQNSNSLIKLNKDPGYDLPYGMQIQQNETIEYHEPSMRYLENNDLIPFPLKVRKQFSWLIFCLQILVSNILPTYFESCV